MEPIAHYWAAAIKSGFAKSADWRDWAEKRIEQSDKPEYWVIQMSLASKYCDLIEPLGEAINLENKLNGRKLYMGNATLGFLYWKYHLRRISFIDLLNEAGAEADSGTADLDCEEVYSVLNRLEDRMANNLAYVVLENEAKMLFEPCFNVAKEHWKSLGNEFPLS
jgi:hypothetical protein